MAVGVYAVGRDAHISIDGTAASASTINATYEVGTSDVTHSEGDGWQNIEPTIKKVSGDAEAVYVLADGIPAGIDVATEADIVITIGNGQVLAGPALMTQIRFSAQSTGDLKMSFNFMSNGAWTSGP